MPHRLRSPYTWWQAGVFQGSNEFHYLTGVARPHAYVLLDGQSGRSTLYLPEPVPGEAAPDGWPERVAPAGRLAADLAARLGHGPRPDLFVPLQPQEGATGTRDTLLAQAAAAAGDAWDGTAHLAARFADLLQRRFPAFELGDPSPICDRLRLRKSAAELALLRQAGRLCGEGILAAMARSAPGAMEYELEAAAFAVFPAGGAAGEGYCAIVASGPNIWDAHYNANARALQDGDLVLMDYAPDFGHHTSDVGRLWPAGCQLLREATHRHDQREATSGVAVCARVCSSDQRSDVDG